MWTDFPERLRPGVQVFVGQTHQDLTIKGMRGHSSDPIIAFDGINRREEAGQFRNQVVYVRVSELPPLPDGEIYLHQMIGMQIVQDADSAVLGRVVEILETGANNVLVVRRTNGPDFLIPDIESVVLAVDLHKSEIRVRLLPGLLPEA
jgi:16S rRNA processing protein RimM